MKKKDFFRTSFKLDRMETHIWDRWVDWRCKRDGVDTRSDEYLDVLHSMPEHISWSPSYIDGFVTISWDGGKDEVPLDQFVDDLDEQPDLTMLWHANYYDGPLSGMAELDGEMVWFEIHDEDDQGYRIFGVYSLDEENKKELIRRNRDFCEQVGYHCCYGDDHKEYGSDEPPSWCPDWLYLLWRKFQFRRFYFFSRREKKLNLTDPGKLIGIFDECEFDRRRKTNV